jgi:predicted O-methyltransferase YrrM
VEIGTLTGLSGLYILDGLQPGGKLWTLEKSEIHAAKARPLLSEFSAQTEKSVEVIVGDARETLIALRSQRPFDFIFIDGNKAAYGDYLNWAEENLKSGGLLVADNVFLGGRIFNLISEQPAEKQIEAMGRFNQRLMNSQIWNSTVVPTGEGLFIASKI